MIKEILLIHHTHTDIGYTHPQPIVFELHHRFIEKALRLADETMNFEDSAKFRWTCEVTGTTRAWWDQATTGDRDRFLAAAHRGQVEIAGLEWHLTPLADLRMLIRSLENVRFFRNLGLTVRSAMTTDVNGIPWGTVDVLLDHGIDGFSMSSNSHMGHPVSPRPGAFKWSSPGGRELTVWNGFQYWHAANVLMKMPSSVDEVAAAVPHVLGETERRGYELSFLPLQITNPHHPDNATPDSTLSHFVSEWNATQPSVKIRTVLLSEIFERLRAEQLPTQSGDWTDYWNFGAGSSTRETSVYMEGLRVLDGAQQATAWPGTLELREVKNLDDAHRDLALYAEHTWGADCSISAPESVETKLQWSIKSAYPFKGLSSARLVLRDGLHRMAQLAGGEEPTVLLYNPLPHPVSDTVAIPVENLGWPLTPGVHHRQRLNGALSQTGEESYAWCKVELPGMGYRTYSVDSLQPTGSEGLAVEENSLQSSKVSIRFAEEGGVESIQIGGIEYCGQAEPFRFGVPILERPISGSRKAFFNLDFSLLEPAEGWIPDWERETTPGVLTAASSRVVAGAAEFTQSFRMVNGDTLTVLYRLFQDDPSIDMEVDLFSAGDASPYSLALPFSLPEAPNPVWHFDTAGALVEFDKEQLPDAAQHYVTARRFVRLQNQTASLSIATPDLPLWKFGGMFFGPTRSLKRQERKSMMLAWLANNYWEVNFLANQNGKTHFRFRVMLGTTEPVEKSYERALPHAVPPQLHAYRELGQVQNQEGRLVGFAGEGFLIEAVSRHQDGLFLVLQNLKAEPNEISVKPGTATWSTGWETGLDGSRRWKLPVSKEGDVLVQLPARGLIGVLLD